MTIPQTIPISSIDLGTRVRSQYVGIDDLAQSIEHNGLVQPIVLAPILFGGKPFEFIGPQFSLVAGGRRLSALISLGVTELFHGVTSTPGAYGFLLRGEPGTELSNLLIEIAENLCREDIDWRDNCRAICRAARLTRKDGFDHGVRILQHDLGQILGVGHQELKAAEAIEQELILAPEDYLACGSIRQAYAVLLKKNAVAMQSLYAKRSIANPGQVAPSQEGGDDNANIGYVPEASVTRDVNVQSITVPLTPYFHHVNGLDFMSRNLLSFDHIICDPDFAVSVDRLESNMSNASVGVAQDSVETSLADLELFLHRAYESLRPRGFLVFFYDLDHHEKLQRWAIAAGFSVQRWPLIWHKTDYRSNASPSTNFCKNIEYAMVCRKEGATLATTQMSSVFSLPSGDTTKAFGHPFAKPKVLWHAIFNAVAIKGQVILDPFAGSGSCPISALEWGLHPVACEVQGQHFNGMLMNVQQSYRKVLGENLRFT